MTDLREAYNLENFGNDPFCKGKRYISEGGDLCVTVDDESLCTYSISKYPSGAYMYQCKWDGTKATCSEEAPCVVPTEEDGVCESDSDCDNGGVCLNPYGPSDTGSCKDDVYCMCSTGCKPGGDSKACDVCPITKATGTTCDYSGLDCSKWGYVLSGDEFEDGKSVGIKCKCNRSAGYCIPIGCGPNGDSEACDACPGSLRDGTTCGESSSGCSGWSHALTGDTFADGKPIGIKCHNDGHASPTCVSAGYCTPTDPTECKPGGDSKACDVCPITKATGTTCDYSGLDCSEWGYVLSGDEFEDGKSVGIKCKCNRSAGYCTPDS